VELNLITLVLNSNGIGSRPASCVISQLHAGKWQITACPLRPLSSTQRNVMLHCVHRPPPSKRKQAHATAVRLALIVFKCS